MNITDWRRREDLQLRLDETLKESHMVEAVSVLMQLGLPGGTKVADLNLNALTNAFNEGYYRCLANLERLRSWKESDNKPMPAPWQKERVRKELE